MHVVDPLETLPSSVAAWPELEDRVRAQFASGRAMRAALAAACEAFGEVAIEKHARAIDESVARRWCWIRSWYLMDQDEDLFLMSDALVVPLLEEAEAECPKRGYAIGIVEHHLRDQVHAALRKGWPEARARIAGSARHARPGKVSRAQAEERVRDFWRCHAPHEVTLETVGDTWRAPLDGRWMIVERKTDAMRIE